MTDQRLTSTSAALSDDPRSPLEYGLGLGFVGLIALTAVLVALRADVGTIGATVVTLTGLVIAAWWTRPMAAVGDAAIAWLLVNGFIVDRQGDLHWHGMADLGRLLALLGGTAAVAALRAVQLSIRKRWTRIPADLPTPRDIANDRGWSRRKYTAH